MPLPAGCTKKSFDVLQASKYYFRESFQRYGLCENLWLIFVNVAKTFDFFAEKTDFAPAFANLLNRNAMMRLILCFTFVLVGLNLFAQSEFSSPGAYGDALFNEHAAVANRNMEYLQYSVHSDDYALVEKKRMALIQQIQESLQNVKAIPPYEEDSKLRDEIAAVFQAYLESFRVEFSQVNTLKQTSKESYEAMEQYLKATAEAEKKLDAAGDRAIAAQAAFARKYKIQLLEDEEKAAGSKMLSRLNNYYRAIFLRVFRISKKDAEFSDALDEKHAGKMERYRKELEVVCDDVIFFLQKMEDFNGDTGYRDAAMELAQQYKELALNGYKNMVAVVRKGDKYTNEDAEAFNRVIEQINTQIPPLHDAVNETSNELFRKNVPKPIETKRI